MKEVSLKYLKRNKNNYSYYFTIFIVLLIIIALELSLNIYSYYLIDLPQEETAMLIESTEDNIKKLNIDSIEIASCSNIDNTRCRVLIKVKDYDEIKSILEEKNIKYILYDNLESVIHFINIRYIFIVVLIVTIVILSFIIKYLINGKIKRENSNRIKLEYLGANNKDILLFDKYYLRILFFTYYIVISVSSVLVSLMFNILDYYTSNWIYINVIIIVSTIYVHIIYKVLLKKNIKSLIHDK